MRVNWDPWVEKVLALFIGFFIWNYVNSQGVVEMAFVVPIEYKDVSENMIIEGNLPQTVTVKLRGNSWMLNNLGSEEVKVIVSLRKVREGINRIKIDEVKVPRGIDVVGVSPEHITIRATLIVEKEVPVRPVFRVFPKKKFIFYPQSVKIRGEKSVVNRISKVKTEPIDGKTLDKFGEVKARLIIPSSIRVDESHVTLEVVR